MGIETAVAIATIAASAAQIGSTVGLFGKPKALAAPQAPSQVDAGETASGATPQQAEDRTRKQAAAAQGRGSTILTSPLGLLDSNSQRPTLLGQ